MRVSFDDLDYSDYHVYTYEDQPFTGIAYDNLSNGQLVAEDSYVEGVQEGISREWYPSGALHYEVYYKSGALHGLCKEWYENGLLKSEYSYEFGIIVTRKSFSEDGNLIEKYKIKDSDSNFEVLNKFRSLQGN
ncbi:toxin-antitoxin system YwqK family antitoxin [Nostoc sp.]|uniref:toxin-antitoxin system YwqK family antitoxin n=1 Tax=Nostoc sp. TaxID=1180 RepID=UPI002FF857CD